MANPFTQKARQRKFIYTALILVLFTGSLMHRRYVVEPQAQDLKLREVAKGEVELTSAAVRLTLTGSRGLAVTFLWAAAIKQQEKHEWNELELLIGAITKLQPYFITPWLFQGWNLAYNVAVECDQPRDKYYYVSRGLQLLAEGERRNEEQGVGQPDLRHFIGVALQGKIGISDEKNAMRSLLELSCIDPVRRNPERFDDGRRAVKLEELARFCRDHPRLVRRLREKLACTEPKQIVDFLAANKDVPGRFEPLVGGLDQKETALKDYRSQFPVLPPASANLVPNPSLTNLGLDNESIDVFVMCRAWYTYAQAPCPPPVADASHNHMEYDRLKYRLPKAPTMPIFRGYPARAQSYIAETRAEEGWFDEDGWLVRDWFDDLHLADGEFRIGTEPKYHSGPAWAKAYVDLIEMGRQNGLYFSPSELRELDQQAEYARGKLKIDRNMPGPDRLRPEHQVEPLLSSWGAHQKLYWRSSLTTLTNFQGHLSTAEAERTPEAVLARKLFHRAERLRRFEDPEQALALYEQAWPVMLGVLARHPTFAQQITNQEEFYEMQMNNLRLIQKQRAREMKTLALAMAQVALKSPEPLDKLLSDSEKDRILPIRTVQGLLDSARVYDSPQREELGRALLTWSQATNPAAGPARLFLFPGQEDLALLTLTHRDQPLGRNWRQIIEDDTIRQVRSRLGIIKLVPLVLGDPTP